MNNVNVQYYDYRPGIELIDIFFDACIRMGHRSMLLCLFYVESYYDFYN
jgi:hypothetical protein